MTSNRRQNSLLNGIDNLFVISTIFLLVGGLVMLASASMPIAVKNLGDPYGYVYKQLTSILLGLSAGLVAFLIWVALNGWIVWITIGLHWMWIALDSKLHIFAELHLIASDNG